MIAIARVPSPPRFALPFSPFGARQPSYPRKAAHFPVHPLAKPASLLSTSGMSDSSGRTSSSDRTSSDDWLSSIDRTSSSDGTSTPPYSPSGQGGHREPVVFQSERGLPPQSTLARMKASPDTGKDLSLAHPQRLSFSAQCVDGWEARPRRPRVSPCFADCFAPRTWLDDASISAVYARFLEPTAALSPHPILLLDASVVFWLALSKRGEGSVQEAVTGLELEKRRIVLCPINDSRNGFRGDGGTHWSLLVCVARPLAGSKSQEFDFLHYDSAQSSRRSLRQAQRVAVQLGGESAKVHARPCAQQDNCFDCGIYMLLFSEIIVHTSLLAGVDTGKSVHSYMPAWEKRLLSVIPRQATLYRMQQRHALLELQISDGKAMQTFSI